MSENMTITYTNYRGETSVRRIKPMTLYYGRSDWHEGWQWILRARDLDKDEVREFALKDFGVPATARDDALEEAARVPAKIRLTEDRAYKLGYVNGEDAFRKGWSEALKAKNAAIRAMKGCKP